MSLLTAEQLAQRIYDCRLMEAKEIEQALGDAGGRGAAGFEEFQSTLLQQELLTNWQIQRLVEGHRRGYFYGQWKVMYMVGAGTFARVYRAVHRQSGDVRAVKVLRSRYSNDEDTRARFMREAKMVMKLRHSNIVPIYEADVDRGRSYMVMDFIEGQNLRDHVKAHKKLKLMVALNVARDLASGLNYAFQLGISHRDMKLSNVLLSSSGQAKLVDFGLAAMNTLDEGEDGSFNPRSVDYAGLEKATGVTRDDTRSDIFFLGCILYHMVAGEPPLSETRDRIKRLQARRYREIAPITMHEPDLPHRFVHLVNRLMDFNPEKRIQTAAAAQKEIETVINAINAGDTKGYDHELSRLDAEAYAERTRLKEEGKGFTVLIIESKVKVQDSLRDSLKSLGYRVLITGDPQRGVQRFENLDPAEKTPADCVIFGCAGLGNLALEAFNRFAEGDNTKEIPSILLTDRHQDYVSHAKLADHRTHLSLPVKFKDIRLALRRLLSTEKANHE